MYTGIIITYYLITMGKVKGIRRAGDRRKSWLRNISERSISSIEQLFRLTRDREKYRKLKADRQY